MKSRIMYIELKAHPRGHDDRGPAWIGRVTLSKTGKTIYYRGRRLQSAKGKLACGNYFDIETGDQFWVSAPKKRGGDRHPCGGGPVNIDPDVRDEYWSQIRKRPDMIHKCQA